MRVLITEKDRIHQNVVDELKGKGFQIDMVTPETLEDYLPEANVMMISVYTKMTRDVLDKAQNLKAILSFSAGLDHIDLDACKEKNIRVYHSPGTNANAVAEHTVGLLLAVLKKIVHADTHVRGGQWERSSFLNHELEGKILGIIGFGAIGKLVAKKMSGFGVTNLAYDPLLNKEQIEKSPGLEGITVSKIDDLETLLSTADMITIHVPLIPETANLLHEKNMKLLKKTCILVNTSRGGLIDENILTTKLQEGSLAGAGLDVFAEEPLKNDTLKTLRNVVLTPHIAAYTHESRERISHNVMKAFLDDFNKGTYA